MNKNIWKSISVLSTLFAFIGTAAELQSSAVTFEAIGKPAFLKIKGEGAKITHVLKEEQGAKFNVFEVNLADLKTGIDMRDEHMKEKYLKVKEFPKAELRVPVADKDIFAFAGETETQGTLTLKGQTKPITVKSKKSGKKITSDFEIKLSDYGIEIPTYAGITVADKVKIQTQFEPALEAPQILR